jgi:hypothetical protein
LDADDITGRYWTGLSRLVSAFSYGEPFNKLLIGATVGQWLLESGLVEEVQNPRRPSNKPRYRLTKLGNAVLQRGRYAKGQPPKRRKLTILQPRVSVAPPRIRQATMQ